MRQRNLDTYGRVSWWRHPYRRSTDSEFRRRWRGLRAWSLWGHGAVLGIVLIVLVVLWLVRGSERYGPHRWRTATRWTGHGAQGHSQKRTLSRFRSLKWSQIATNG